MSLFLFPLPATVFDKIPGALRPITAERLEFLSATFIVGDKEMLDLSYCLGIIAALFPAWPRRRGRQRSGCLVQRRRPAWLTQVIQIFPIEGGERGFDRGAEAGYAFPNTLAEKRGPYAGLHENLWGTNRGGTAGMELAIQFGAMPGRDVIEKFRGHLTVTTFQDSCPDWKPHA